MAHSLLGFGTIVIYKCIHMITQTSSHLIPSGNEDREAEKAIRIWQEFLPDTWREAALVPLDFRHYREYEMDAQRYLGYDENGEVCFTRYDYTLSRLASDDGEEFYEVITHHEIVSAWRLRDERWLIFSKTGSEHCHPPRGFYRFSSGMPR